MWLHTNKSQGFKSVERGGNKQDNFLSIYFQESDDLIILPLWLYNEKMHQGAFSRSSPNPRVFEKFRSLLQSMVEVKHKGQQSFHRRFPLTC